MSCACWLTSIHACHMASSSSRGKLGTDAPSVRHGQRHGWAVPHRTRDRVTLRFVGMLIEHHHLVRTRIESEYVRCFELAHLVALTQLQIGRHVHRARLRYLTRHGCAS